MSSRYQAVYGALREAIADGRYPPGSALPSESELGLSYGVARGTVRQAFELLARDGLISTRKGARRLVLEQPRVQSFNELRSFSDWARAIGERPSGTIIDLVRRAATPDEAGRLGVERVYHLTRVRTLSGRPVMVERTAYPERIGALVAGFAAGDSITERLRDFGVEFASATHTLTAVLASARDAQLLGTSARAALMCEQRLSLDPAGTPLEWSEDRYVGQAVAFTVHNSVRSNALIRGIA